MLPALLLALAPPAYRIVDLGFPPGADKVEAIAVDNRGEVLLRAGDHGYLWRDGRLIDFGKPIDSQMTGEAGRTEPKALNDLGVAVGGQGGLGPVFMSGLDDVNAFVWRGKGLEDLGAGSTTEANDVNNLGDVVGGGNHRAFARLRGKLVWLPTLSHVAPRDPNGEMNDVNRAEAVAIDDRRQILMNSTYGPSSKEGSPPTRPFLVDGNAPSRKPRPVAWPKESVEASGLDLNERGDVLATAFFAKDRFAPYLALRGRVAMLPYPEGCPFQGKLNARGDVVGTMARRVSPAPSYAPALWLAGRRVPFPTFAGWTIQTATGINDRGMVCGSGLHGGKPRAYLLVPLRGFGGRR